MFNRTGFNTTFFNEMKLDSLISLNGEITSFGNVSGNLFRIIPLSILINQSSSVQSKLNRTLKPKSTIISNSDIMGVINMKSILYSDIINNSFSTIQMQRIIKSIVTISEISNINSKTNRLILKDGIVHGFSETSIIMNNNINLVSNINSNTNIYSDVGILFDLNGNLISNSSIDLKPIKSSNINSDLEIISNILVNCINYEYLNSVKLSGSFEKEINKTSIFTNKYDITSIFTNKYDITSEFINKYDITSEFIKEILLKGLM